MIAQILNLLGDFKKEAAVLATVSSVCFTAGRMSVPAPNEADICHTYTQKVTALESAKTKLESRVSTLEAQVSEVEEACAKRIRTSLDEKDEACSKQLGEKIAAVKKNYITFKCSRCKRLGQCK